MTFEEASLLPRSEKITLITIESAQQVKIFNTVSTFLFSKQVSYFVSSVSVEGVALTKGSSESTLGVDEWFFVPSEMKIYISIAVNPSSLKVILFYTHFFSNSPVILPYNLSSGDAVEWLPYISGTGSIGQTLDDENTGVVLESSSSVSLINQGYFDSIFDTLIWENKKVSFYYWFPITPISEARKIFEGIIDSKNYAPDRITFNVKDFIFRLRDKLNLGVFSESDGSILDSNLGTPKRRIYGRVDKCQAIGIDCVKNGYNLTGLITGVAASKQVTGVGTLFTDELSTNDEIKLNVNGVEVKYNIDYIQDNTNLFLSKNIEENFTSISATVVPAIPWRKKNRRWHIAGHKLTRSTATIVTVINSRQFVVDDNSEFFADDVVTINGVTTQVTRISGSQIVLEQSIFPIPLTGNVITKEPVLSAYFGNNKMILNRDFTITNLTESIIEIDPLAEFNLAVEKVTTNTPTSTPITLTFTNGSRVISTASNVDLKTIIKPRDWIRSLVQSNDVWFEVMKVEERAVIIRNTYTQTTNTNTARIKEVDIINDDSLITIDCYGITYENKWVKTASDAIRHLMKNDAGFTQINEATFDQANSDCNFTLSMVIPEALGSDYPSIKDISSKINDSVFGSLYGNTVQQICYSIVNTRRPETIQPLKDDDIVSWSSESRNTIINNVNVKYSPFIDTVLGEASFKTYNFESSFVDDIIGINNAKELYCYLYDDADAVTIAQRYAFVNSLSQLKVTIKGKSLFFNYSVNDRIYLDLDRLYKRYASGSKLKMGIVSSVKKSEFDSEIVLNDLGNIFNRCPSIATNTTSAYSSATNDDKIKFGFILDSNTLIPGSNEEDLGSCLIG
jgi:hypothetical protein